MVRRCGQAHPDGGDRCLLMATRHPDHYDGTRVWPDADALHPAPLPPGTGVDRARSIARRATRPSTAGGR